MFQAAAAAQSTAEEIRPRKKLTVSEIEFSKRQWKMICREHSRDSLSKSTCESRRREKAARVQGLVSRDPRAPNQITVIGLLDVL